MQLRQYINHTMRAKREQSLPPFVRPDCLPISIISGWTYGTITIIRISSSRGAYVAGDRPKNRNHRDFTSLDGWFGDRTQYTNQYQYNFDSKMFFLLFPIRKTLQNSFVNLRVYRVRIGLYNLSGNMKNLPLPWKLFDVAISVGLLLPVHLSVQCIALPQDYVDTCAVDLLVSYHVTLLYHVT